MSDPTCLKGGFVAGADVPLPDDKRVYYQTQGQLVGCNRLYCDVCGSWVKVFSGYKPWGGTKTKEEQERFYDSDNPSEWPFLHAQGAGDLSRVYRCRCWTEWTTGFKQVSEMDINWRCAGHPQP